MFIGMNLNSFVAPPCRNRMSCVSGTDSSDLHLAIASSSTPSNSLPRWLHSAIPNPLPWKSTRALADASRPSVGSIAGPALKLNTRLLMAALLPPLGPDCNPQDRVYGCVSGRGAVLTARVGLVVY